MLRPYRWAGHGVGWDDADVADALLPTCLLAPMMKATRTTAPINSSTSWSGSSDMLLNYSARGKAFKHAKAKHPGFEQRAHPDMLPWATLGTVQPRPPMTVANLHERITEMRSRRTAGSARS